MNLKLVANILRKQNILVLNKIQIRRFLNAPFKELDSFPKTIDSYESLHKFSIQEPDKFWGTVARSRLEWFKDFKQVTQGDFNDPDFKLKWFIDGKMNVSVNCVDRHYLKNPDKIALIWEKDQPDTEEYVTYSDLYKLMNRIANMLKSYNIKKGDRVAIYMPCSTMAVATMLACARIGAVHSVIFAGFSAEAIASRIQDSQCSAIVTANQGVRGGKFIELKKTVDEAVKNCPSIQNVFVFKRTSSPIETNNSDVIVDNVLDSFSTECLPEVMDSEDPLFMLYTSGSTGKPKGLIHTQAGYLLHAALSHQLTFNYSENDVWGCMADIGWITGNFMFEYTLFKRLVYK